MKRFLLGTWRSRTVRYLALPMGMLGAALTAYPSLAPSLGSRTYGIGLFIISTLVYWFRSFSAESLENKGMNEDEKLEEAARSEH